MPRPKFEKGKEKTGGREKGTPNKISKNIKENFDAVFEKLGGIDGFYEWANIPRNQGSFFQMYSKMLPTNMNIDADVSHFVYQISEQFLPKDEKKGKKEDITVNE